MAIIDRPGVPVVGHFSFTPYEKRERVAIPKDAVICVDHRKTKPRKAR